MAYASLKKRHRTQHSRIRKISCWKETEYNEAFQSPNFEYNPLWGFAWQVNVDNRPLCLIKNGFSKHPKQVEPKWSFKNDI